MAFNAIPDDKLPIFFKDEKRRNVLYAPLRSKSANPNDWNNKITSWSQLINLYCNCNQVYHFTIDSLKEAFKFNGITPNCLEEVIQEMCRKNEIKPYNNFILDRPVSWKYWLINKASSSVFWSLSKVKDLVQSKAEETNYVPLKVLEENGDSLLNNPTFKDKLMSLKEYLDIESVNQSKAEDFKILFLHLYIRGRIDLIESENLDEFLIKFSNDKISEKDLSLRKLVKNEQSLEKNVEILEDQVVNCVNEAKNQLKKGHRNLAKSSLRKKHEIEHNIEKKMRMLYNVQVLLQKLQNSEVDEEVWNSYKKILNVFEESHKEMNEDLVEDTMIKVEEMLDIQRDIQNALSRPLTDDNEDLEKELDELISMDDQNNKSNKGSPQQSNTSKLDQTLQELDLNLPSVPSSPLNISDENCESSQLN